MERDPRNLYRRLSMSAIIDIQAYLSGAGLGLTSGTNLFRYLMPPSPDICVALDQYDSMSPEPDLGSNPGVIRAEYPLIQAVARGVPDDGDGPSAMLKAIVDKLMLVGSSSSLTTLSGTRYQAIIPKQTPFFRNRDDNFRQEWVCNFQVYKDY